MAEQLENLNALNQVTVPDLWQQQAVSALREGKDVVVHAPTGAGKTLIFELWSNQGKNRGQAIYTVPTRALANDKLAEWRARGWDVGIATGDLSDNLGAPVIVATLETQKNRLIQGDGPTLLVVDEYQMIGDPDRGLNYELALALAPRDTQLLLLSGSVANPQDLVKWMARLGRSGVLVRHDHRPVPLEEVHGNQISVHVPNNIRGYWPRLIAKALADDLGPILIFAPRRQGAEAMASELARYLPTPDPLQLSLEQKKVVGENLAKMLKSRITYHHSGLSYAARAGVIEPLAKAGQLRVVVATMGLAAGINFSLRSVALAGESYRRDAVEQMLRGDEILQMFGRAGRRGLDETGYVIVSANEIRLLDARSAHLARSGSVDWSALLVLMTAAAQHGRDPFAEAVSVQERLFTTKPVILGIEESIKHPNVPCGLKTDSERARHVRKRVREIINSRGEWETIQPAVERRTEEIFYRTKAAGRLGSGEEQEGAGRVMEGNDANDAAPHPGPLPQRGEGDVAAAVGNDFEVSRSTEAFEHTRPAEDSGPHLQHENLPALRPLLMDQGALEKVGHGHFVVLEERRDGNIYGRSITVADRIAGERVILSKWIRRMTNWNGREASLELFQSKIAPLIEKKLAEQKFPVVRFKTLATKVIAEVSLGAQTMRVPVDSHGVALYRPPEREVLPPDCALCALAPVCKSLPTNTGVALLWKRLKLIDDDGVPTNRGRVVSFFSQGDGLAIAACLEDASYPLNELIYDLANLDAGFRFAGDENRWGGRMAMACHDKYDTISITGYLENGLPPKYGAGGEKVVAAIHKNPLDKHRWVTDLSGPGDIDRVIIEWRSLLRQIAHAPELNWERWNEFRRLAREILNETESPTVTDLPPLEYYQTKRVDHRLQLRRH